MHLIHKEKRKSHFGDCNHFARLRKAYRTAPPTTDYEKGYDQIKWKSGKGESK